MSLGCQRKRERCQKSAFPAAQQSATEEKGRPEARDLQSQVREPEHERVWTGGQQIREERCLSKWPIVAEHIRRREDCREGLSLQVLDVHEIVGHPPAAEEWQVHRHGDRREQGHARPVARGGLMIGGNVFYGFHPSGSFSSFAFGAASDGVPPFHGGIGALSGGYNDSIGPQTLSTRSVKRSPIRISVTVPRKSG